MLINFTKMHALGNDFVIIDGITQNFKLNSAYIKKIANRNTGVGCDQVIILAPPINPLSDFYYTIYNANGKIAEQCINGARCAARFALDVGLINKEEIVADCAAGQVIFIVDQSSKQVSAKINLINPLINCYQLHNNNYYYVLSIGNPHAIIIISKESGIDNSQYLALAAEIKNHQKQQFPLGLNIGFAKIIDNNKIELNVIERGVGVTLACGSNAIAAFLVAKSLNLINNNCNIWFKLGFLHVILEQEQLILTSVVNAVFIGRLKI